MGLSHYSFYTVIFGEIMFRNFITTIAYSLAFATALSTTAFATQNASNIIELSQIPCQFIESETKNQNFTTTQKSDCDKINAETAEIRLKEAKPLVLKAGEYIFRVTNKNVPYELGFWLREKGYDWRNPIDKLTKTSISGGGMTLGKTQDYKVTLKPGEYVYSCPLNTTPDYRLIVQ